MEGWYWRFTDAGTGRVALALCGVNRHASGDWAIVAVATAPGTTVVSAVVEGAFADRDRFEVRAGDVLQADGDGVRVRLPGAHLDGRLVDRAPWPRQALHGGGVASVIPFLGQYWHPFELGGRAEVEVSIGSDGWSSSDARAYAERNWGAGFPDRWWWGQCHDLEGLDACVSFGGGRLTAGLAGVDVTGAVIRIGEGVLRFAPPFCRVRSSIGGGRWRVEARRRGWHLRLDGDVGAGEPHVLPVPLPAERRNVDTDLEALDADLHVVLRHGTRTVLDARSSLAALEVGSLDPGWARSVWSAADPAAVVA